MNDVEEPNLINSILQRGVYLCIWVLNGGNFLLVAGVINHHSKQKTPLKFPKRRLGA